MGTIDALSASTPTRAEDNFSLQVKRLLDSFLTTHGFVHTQTIIENSLRTQVIYTSTHQNLVIYDSIPEGEVNCLIGSRTASLENIRPPAYTYLFGILLQANRVTREELRAMTAAAPRGWPEQLQDIASRLIKNFDVVIHQG